jgi:hypothetical protein
MKNILRYFSMLVVGGILFTACEEKESNFEKLTDPVDLNSTTYYVQFINAAGSFQTSNDAEGNPTNVVTTIAVKLLGVPQSSAVTVNLAVDNSSTLLQNMYTLSANSITIPAGSTSGSVDLTAIGAQMVECEFLDLVVNIDAGANNATQGTQLVYTFLRNAQLGELETWVGSWTGSDDAGYASQAVTALDNGSLTIVGLNAGWIVDFWGESITEMVPVIIDMNADGTLSIAKQYYMTTDYQGDPYRYEIDGSGTWNGCDKAMVVSYNIYYEGSSETAYGPSFPITETITLNN